MIFASLCDNNADVTEEDLEFIMKYQKEFIFRNVNKWRVWSWIQIAVQKPSSVDWNTSDHQRWMRDVHHEWVLKYACFKTQRRHHQRTQNRDISGHTKRTKINHIGNNWIILKYLFPAKKPVGLIYHVFLSPKSCCVRNFFIILLNVHSIHWHFFIMVVCGQLWGNEFL